MCFERTAHTHTLMYVKFQRCLTDVGMSLSGGDTVRARDLDDLKALIAEPGDPTTSRKKDNIKFKDPSKESTYTYKDLCEGKDNMTDAMLRHSVYFQKDKKTGDRPRVIFLDG